MVVVSALGSSLTERAGWLAPLEAELARNLGMPVTVYDFGRAGGTSEWGISVLHTVLQSRPDILLVEFAANDASLLRGLTLHRSRENTTQLVMTVKAALPRVKIFLMSMNPLFGPRAWVRPRVMRYCRMYETLADELNVGYIDNRQKWKALSKKELKAGIPDGEHPLPHLAAKILVPNVAQAIVDALGAG